MIRKYRPADCEDVLNAWARASAVAHPFLSQEFLELERHNIPSASAESRDLGLGFHRSGIGRALMDRARTLRGELEVEVFERNLLGRAFYEKLGFELIRQTVHDQTGFEVMRLRLAARNPLQPTGCAGS